MNRCDGGGNRVEFVLVHRVRMHGIVLPISILFKIPIWAGIKRLLFGIQKPYFICFVVCIWWGIEYFRMIYFSPDIRIFVHNLKVGDPCFVDTSYLYERQQTLNNVCTNLMPMIADFQPNKITIRDVLQEVSHFQNDCSCPFPNVHIQDVLQNLDRSGSLSNVTNVGFTDTFDLCSGGGGNGDDCKCARFYLYPVRSGL